VRPFFRILGGLFCLAVIVVFVLDPKGSIELWFMDGFNLIGLTIVFPLFLHAALFGKMPDFIVQNVSEDTFRDLTNMETYFKEFSPKTIGFAVVAAIMFAFFLYRNFRG
jgi:hypothetical protein